MAIDAIVVNGQVIAGEIVTTTPEVTTTPKPTEETPTVEPTLEFSPTLSPDAVVEIPAEEPTH